MTVNYLMIPSDDGQLPHVYRLVMMINYLMVSSAGGQLPHGF